MRGKYWTKEEIQYLKDNYLTKGNEELTKGLPPGRTNKLICAKLKHLKLSRGKLIRKDLWTEKEINFLKDNYLTKCNAELAKGLPGKKSSVIGMKLRHLKLSREKYTRKDLYTEKEIQYLKENYLTKTNREMANKLKRTTTAITTYLRRIKLSRGKKLSYKLKDSWTKEEIQYLKDNYLNKWNREMGKELGRTPPSIAARLVKLKLKREKTNEMRRIRIYDYTKEEKQYLKDNYLTKTNREMGKELGRTRNAICRELQVLKLSRGKVIINKLRENVSLETRKKLSVIRQEIECKDWNGFISFEPYCKNFNEKFKRAIRKRDNQICMLCEIHREKLKKALAVHHINYDKLSTIPENCLSLCNTCHSKSNHNRKHWITFFQNLLSEKYGYEYENGKPIIQLEVIS